MPKTGIRQTFDLTTRGIAKVNCEIGITVDGRELPSMSVLGGALEKAVELIQKEVVDSYKVVPERVDGGTPTQPTPLPQAAKPIPFSG